MASFHQTRIPPLPTIQELIKLYRLGAKKRLSQNFLFNQSTIKKLVRSAGDLTDHHVCEVGPGPGGITREILNARIKQLTVIERDERFLPILRNLASVYDGMEKPMKVFHGDILKFNMSEVFPLSEVREWVDSPPQLCVMGNLPFNISTPLIIRWLADISRREGAWRFGRTKLVLTFQKEVGERMVADVMDAQRSRLSIMCQYLCDVKMKHIIPGKAFVPPPEVDVAVVSFVPKITPLISQPFPVVEKVVRHVFHYRQKYCRRGLLTLFPDKMEDCADELLREVAVDPTTRPQQLSIEEFSRICDSYSRYCASYPGLFDYYYRDSRSREEAIENIQYER